MESTYFLLFLPATVFSSNMAVPLRKSVIDVAVEVSIKKPSTAILLPIHLRRILEHSLLPVIFTLYLLIGATAFYWIENESGPDSRGYPNCILLAFSLVTTVGRGLRSLNTGTGRFISIIYTTIGIPLLLLLVNSGSRPLSRLLMLIEKVLFCGYTIKHNNNRRQSDGANEKVRSNPSLLVTFTLLVAWVAGGAFLFHHHFRVDTYFGAFYALYMTLARVNVLAAQGQIGMLAVGPIILYLLVGIALVNICIDVGVCEYGCLLSRLHFVLFGTVHSPAQWV